MGQPRCSTFTKQIFSAPTHHSYCPLNIDYASPREWEGFLCPQLVCLLRAGDHHESSCLMFPLACFLRI